MPTIFAGRRRRPTSSSGSAGTPFRGSGASGGNGIRGTIFSGSGSRLPLKGCSGRFGCGATILVILLVIVFLFFQYCGGGFDLGSLFSNMSPLTTDFGYNSGQLANLNPAAPFSTYYSPSTVYPASTGTGLKWLVMLYQDADDSVLEKDICFDLNEAEKAGSSSGVNVVAQLDRYAGAYSGDGNWTGTKRFILTQDSNLERLNAQEVADLGEVNMSAASTLIDFVTWAVETYPAEKYALILSDHGMGWPGGWSDATSEGDVDESIPLQASMSDHLYLNELDMALNQIRTLTDIDKFEIIGMDACLMGQLEVFTMLAAHSRYAVASEEVEPAIGWAYTSFIQELNQNPGMDGAGLGQAIVRSYIEEDQSIIDSNTQGDLLSPGSPFGGFFGDNVSSNQLALELGQESSLTTVDLSKIGQINLSLNHLVYLYQQVKQQNLASSRTYAQSFTNIFGSDVPASYLDIGNLIQIAKQKVGDPAIDKATDSVLSAIRQAIVAEKHGSKLPGATGISIYFPNSELYGYMTAGAESYTAIASRFAVESLWDDFLAFHYSGREFSENDAAPVIPGDTVRSPGVGGISISRVTASSSVAAYGHPVTLSADISGENIGHIYLFVGYYDEQAGSICIADQDYLESSDTRQVNGVYYPDWGVNAFTLQFEWEPIIFAISDGKNQVPALFSPYDYGRTYEEAVYTVDGLYTVAETNTQLNARLYFSDGVLRKVCGFSGAMDASSPREIIPAAGDKFTVFETWLDIDANGKVINTVNQQGGSLVFGDEMFTWVSMDMAAGEYAVGFIVEDLDGNRQESMVYIKVQ